MPSNYLFLVEIFVMQYFQNFTYHFQIKVSSRCQPDYTVPKPAGILTMSCRAIFSFSTSRSGHCLEWCPGISIRNIFLFVVEFPLP